MIDEGQNMTRDTLKLIHYLLNFETNTVKLLQMVLAGQMELGNKIMHYKELASRMFPIAMNAMSLQDLKDMLEFRWMVAGGKESPFSEDAHKAIFVYSKGLPRDAIKLADETLRRLFVTGQKQADEAVIEELAKNLNLSK